MTRWTFFFDQGNVSSEVEEEEENRRISNLIRLESARWLYMSGKERDLFVDLKQVKCISKEQVDEESLSSVESHR